MKDAGFKHGVIDMTKDGLKYVARDGSAIWSSSDWPQ